MNDTDLPRDLELIRRDLLEATGRDVQRRRRDRVPVRALVVAAVAFAAVGGIAVAAPGAPGDVMAKMSGLAGGADNEASRVPSAAESRRLNGFEELKGVAPDGAYPGDAVGEGVVAVRARRDGYAFALTATPTSKGEVCFNGALTLNGRELDGLGGCLDRLDSDWPISIQNFTLPSKRLVLGGLVSDEVRQVRFVTEDGTEAAMMGPNSFAWIEGRETAPPTSIELELKDGSTIRHHTDQFVKARAQELEFERCVTAAGSAQERIAACRTQADGRAAAPGGAVNPSIG